MSGELVKARQEIAEKDRLIEALLEEAVDQSVGLKG